MSSSKGNIFRTRSMAQKQFWYEAHGPTMPDHAQSQMMIGDHCWSLMVPVDHEQRQAWMTRESQMPGISIRKQMPGISRTLKGVGGEVLEAPQKSAAGNWTRRVVAFRTFAMREQKQGEEETYS